MDLGRHVVYPYCHIGNGMWSITDESVRYIHTRMVEEYRKDEVVFSEGEVGSADAFLAYLQHPGVYSAVVMDQQTSEPVFVGWCTGIERGRASAHFCSIGRYIQGTSELIFRYIRGLRDHNGDPLIDVLVGMLPDKNPLALEFMKRIGVQVGGYVPKYFRSPTGERFGAHVIYLDLEVHDG